MFESSFFLLGNVVDEAEIEQNLIISQKVGLGGVQITPIYGLKGEEPNYLDYLSSYKKTGHSGRDAYI